MTPKIIIVGAPRSGTNMLRDVLARVPDFATWPCDEVNLLWRHGNRSHPSDELTVEQATPPVGSFMQHQFEQDRQEVLRLHGGREDLRELVADRLRERLRP